MSRNPKSARYDFNFEVPTSVHSARVNKRGIPGGKKCKGGAVVPSPHQIEISGGAKLNTGRGEVIETNEAIKPLDGGKKCKKGAGIDWDAVRRTRETMDKWGFGKKQKGGAMKVEAGAMPVEAGAMKVEAGKKPRGKKAGAMKVEAGAGIGSIAAHAVGHVLGAIGLGKKPRGKKGGAMPVEAGATKVEAGKKPRGKKAAGIGSDIVNTVGDVLDAFGAFGLGKKQKVKKGGFQSGPLPGTTNPLQTQNPITQDVAKREQGGAMAVKAGKKQTKPKKAPSQWVRCVQEVRKLTGGSYKDSMSASKDIYYNYQREAPNVSIEEYLRNHKNQ